MKFSRKIMTPKELEVYEAIEDLQAYDNKGLIQVVDIAGYLDRWKSLRSLKLTILDLRAYGYIVQTPNGFRTAPSLLKARG